MSVDPATEGSSRRRVELAESIPDGPTRAALTAVLTELDATLASELTWLHPLALPRRYLPFPYDDYDVTPTRASRVEVRLPDRTRPGRALRLVEEADGSVYGSAGGTGEPMRVSDAGSLYPHRVSDLARSVEESRTASVLVSNAEVADLTRLVFGLSLVELGSLARDRTVSRRTSSPRTADPRLDLSLAPVLHGNGWVRGPWEVRSDLDSRLLSVLRDVTAGTPVEWALRRASERESR